jgi:hypothetical protein
MTIITIKEAAILHYIRKYPTSDINVVLISRLALKPRKLQSHLYQKVNLNKNFILS